MNIDITSGGSSVSTNSGLKGERHFGEASHSTTDATRINTSNYFSTESQLQSSSALPPLLMDIPPTVSAEIANTSTSGRSMMASFRRLSLLAASTAETMTASLARSVVTTGNNSPPCGSASASSSAFTSTNDIVVQSSASNTSISVYKRHIMIQDRYLPSTSLSPLHAPLKYLWSSPQEVIPCALSLGVHTAAGVSDMPGLEPYKRPVPSPPLSSFYMDALKSANSTDDVEKQKEDSISLPTSLSIPPLDALTPEAQGYMQGKGNIYVSGARSYDAPFYFCLDYRTPAERAHTGLFPKSLLLDKHFLNDAEKLAEVLAMLEPLAQNVHLCIVGSGETYVRYSYMHTKVLKQRLQGQGGQGVGQQGSMSERMGVKLNIGGEGTASGRLFALARSVTGINKQHDGGNNSPSASSSAPIAATTDTTSSSNSSHTGDEEYQNFTDTNWDDSYPNTDPALVELLGDYRRQLASIATFFMRRSFKHVSVLDGGFCGALKFLVGSIGKSIDTIPSSSSSRSSTGDGEKGKAGDSPDPHQHHWKMVKARLTGLLVDCNPEMIRCILTDDHDFDAATGTDMGISIGKSGDCGGGSSSSHIGGDFGNGSSESIDSKSHGGGEESLLRSEEQGQRRAYADDMQSHASEVGPDDLLKHYMDIAQGVERRAKVEFDTSSKLSSRVKSAGVSMSSGFASLGGNMKKRFSMFGSGSSTVDESDSNRREDAVGNGMMDKNNGVCINTAPAFVIDDDDEDSDCTPPASPTSNTTTMAAKIAPVAKTEAEKAEALAVHKLNGLQRGDVVTITKKDLPGTVLFPATKFISVAGVANAATVKDGTSSETGSGNIELSVKLVPRFLVVSRERFLVLQVAAGAPMGIGSEATVVLNEHLTQLIRVTFRKKDPEMINLFFKNDGSIVNSSIREDEEDSTDEERIRRYRVSKRAELVETLQRNMQRFK